MSGCNAVLCTDIESVFGMDGGTFVVSRTNLLPSLCCLGAHFYQSLFGFRVGKSTDGVHGFVGILLCQDSRLLEATAA